MLNLYAIPLLVVAVILLGLMLYAALQLHVWGARPFILLTLAAALWSLGYAVELSSPTMAAQLFWANIQYHFIVLVPAAWLAFALSYTRNERLSWRAIGALAVEPLLVVFLTWTDETHHLLRASVTFNTSGPFPELDITRGPFFWIHTAYSYLLFLSGTVLLVQSAWRSVNLYRNQAVLLLIGSLTPFVGNILFLFNLNPFAPLDITPFAFTVSALTFFWSLFRYRLLDLLPVARASLFDNMTDAILVIDLQDRVLDLNPAARQIFALGTRRIIGGAVSALLSDQPQVTTLLTHASDTSIEVSLPFAAEQRFYEVRLSPLIAADGKLQGRLLLWHDMTHRKRLSEELNNFFEISVDMIGIATIDGHFVRVNAAFERTLGWSPEEMLRIPYLDLVHPDDLQITQSILQALGRGKPLHNFENRFRCKDGSYRWLSWSARAVSGEQGRLYAMARDVTDLKQIELDFRDSSRYIEQLNKLTRAAIAQTDFHDMLQVLADRLQELFNADQSSITLWDEAQQRTIPAAASGSIRQTYTSLKILPGEPTMTASVLNAGQVLIAEDVFNTPYISQRIASQFETRSMMGLPLIADGRKLGAALLSYYQPHKFNEHEVTQGEQAAAQIALAVSKAQLYQTASNERQQLRALIEASRDGIVLMSMERRLLVLNPPALKMLGAPGTVDDWMNRPLPEMIAQVRQIAPDLVKTTLAELRRIQHGDEPMGEGTYGILGRTIHWVNIPVLVGETPLGRLMVMRDVTEERMLEKMRDDLTHTMVHDLRNPLASIRSGLDILQMDGVGNFSADQKDILDTVNRGSQRMLELVNSILEVTRLENGQIPLHKHPVHFLALLADTFDLELPLAQAKKILLEQDVPDTLPFLNVDIGYTQRILQNLIGNAIKFTPEGGMITVTACPEEDDAGMILIEVRDTGGGIPPEIQNRLFQKFITGRQTGRGSGLGLAFCKLAVEAHGGRLWVETELHKGAAFKFTLPKAITV